MEYVSVNEKVTTWIRTTYQVKNVDSQEEALEKIVEIYKSNKDVLTSKDVEPYGTEELFECEEYMSPEDNSGEATIEIVDASGNIIWDNSIKV